MKIFRSILDAFFLSIIVFNFSVIESANLWGEPLMLRPLGSLQSDKYNESKSFSMGAWGEVLNKFGFHITPTMRFRKDIGNWLNDLEVKRAIEKQGNLDLGGSRQHPVLKDGLIPEEIGEFKTLRYLDLGANALKTSGLPGSKIWDLENLLYLDLSNNDLRSLPGEIGRLKELRFLRLFGNRLTDLPEEISELKNLEYLDLGGNGQKFKNKLSEIIDQRLRGKGVSKLKVYSGDTLIEDLSERDLSIDLFDLDMSLGLLGSIAS